MHQSNWAAQELQTLRLGDRRLHPRLFHILDTLARHPEASIPEAFGNWADTKAFYRFCSSDNVHRDQINGAHFNQTYARLLSHSRILAIQDKTELDFTTHKATKRLGPIGSRQNQGFLVQSVLAASDTGLPLGLLQQFVWTRDPKTRGQGEKCRKRILEDKETICWCFGLTDSDNFVPATLPVVCICDREGDFFDLFVQKRRPHCDLLVRAAYNRCVDEEAKHLFAAVEQAELAGIKTLPLRSHNRTGGREVTLAVRFKTVTLKPPNYRKDLNPVTLQVVLAQEVDPPAGEKALRWVLLTSCEVQSFSDASQMLEWYAHRWLIERYHYVLKSGCHLEDLQLQTLSRLLVALSLYSMVAWRLLYLTYLARQQPELSCEVFLAEPEWQTLYCVVHQTPTPPASPPSLSEAVVWIARLGGFLARKGDGPPGVKTLWRGLRRLQDMAQTWQLLRGQNCG
jgi:hypothetical protein